MTTCTWTTPHADRPAPRNPWVQLAGPLAAALVTFLASVLATGCGAHRAAGQLQASPTPPGRTSVQLASPSPVNLPPQPPAQTPTPGTCHTTPATIDFDFNHLRQALCLTVGVRFTINLLGSHWTLHQRPDPAIVSLDSPQTHTGATTTITGQAHQTGTTLTAFQTGPFSPIGPIFIATLTITVTQHGNS